ncbi:IucA/IucC family siderophore biosynthesis protein [Streptomyces sp. MNU89]|uniref:IucA/IucC family protein n=1 Tax=Streptomyces sp. MNU89 TaxID=2560025 RepID=UPI001E5996AF|nr:IucA/IucC family protein [Streptomyces sp. MNU89]MCC9739063.1 iron transporter [Streptomyces sp. MNU89]
MNVRTSGPEAPAASPAPAPATPAPGPPDVGAPDTAARAPATPASDTPDAGARLRSRPDVAPAVLPAQGAAAPALHPPALPPPPRSAGPPDPGTAADTAAAENLLRCWVRETGTPAPAGNTLRIPLTACGTALRVPVHHWSACGWHRFGTPVLVGAPEDSPPVDAVALAALLVREARYGARGRSVPGDGADLVGRVADSVRRTAAFLTARRADPETPPGTARFLDGEQALLLGHPLHPTPKSREGLSDAEAGVCSPELRGAFPLHWLAAAPSVLSADSAWTERGRTVPAERLAERLAGPGAVLPEGTVPLPLHPWQAHAVRHLPAVAELLDRGLLHDLGAHGPVWHPTSSLRTVYRPDAPAMLKLSLGLRITNSRRENLPKELRRGVEVHRLLRTGLGERWQSAHPSFDIVRDPAWLAVRGPGGEPVPGLDAVIRHNPFRPGDDAVCVAGLVSPRPWPGRGDRGVPAVRSRLAQVLGDLAARTGRPPAAVATEWFLRYLEAVVRPVLWLDATAGIALEAHQQNTLVLLDAEGWPAGGRYRDNQGYYFRESRRAELERRLPGIGTASDTFVPDEVADERFAYYLGINNVLGLIGAFGSQRLADERILLAAFRRFLTDAARGGTGHGGAVSPLPRLLLESATLRCKANLLTRLHGLDELAGPVDTQSVYVTVPNPLAASGA